MKYQIPKYPRLEPRTPFFQGGRIAETDVLNLAEAARFASVHAGAEITPADFLRAAGRGEITLRAIVHQTAKLQKIGGGVYCNAGQPNENTVPMRSILNLPLSACQQLAATGRASWRKFDGFEQIDGVLMRYAIAELMPDELDFETTPDDCRFTGNAVHALADAFKVVDDTKPQAAPAQTTTKPAPVVAVSASGGVKPAAVPTWSLKTSMQRAPGYRWPLYQFLKAAQAAGMSCPKARDVLEGWKLNTPPELQVMTDGVKYSDGVGNTKEANLKAIQQAIKGLLQKKSRTSAG